MVDTKQCSIISINLNKRLRNAQRARFNRNFSPVVSAEKSNIGSQQDGFRLSKII